MKPINPKRVKLMAEHNRIESLLKDFKGKQHCIDSMNRLRELKQILKI